MPIIWLCALAVGCGAVAALADPFVDEIRRDTEWLAGYASRVPGTEGHAAAQESLLERVRAVPGAVVWTQEFPVLAPTVDRAELVVDGGAWAGTHRVYPVWPDLVRLKSTPPEGLAGGLTYVGAAAFSDLPARSLRGRIAVMEMSAYADWREPFAMGASAVLLLGGAGDRAEQPAHQALYQPRYYVPEGALAEALRRGEVESATIHCQAHWRTVTARNILALVKSAADAAQALPPVALAAAYDSMSVIMGLAPGADSAVDAALLLGLLRETAAAPPARSVLFCFVDAYAFNQLGMRQLLALLSLTPNDATRQDYEKQDAERLKMYREYVEQADKLGTGAEAIEQLSDTMRYRELQRFVKDHVAREMVLLREETGKLRLAVYKADESEKPGLQRELQIKTDRIRQINGTLTRMLTAQALEDENLEADLTVWESARKRVADQCAFLEHHAAEFERLDAIRKTIVAEMGLESENSPPVSYLIGLDLSDAGTTVGPGLYCAHLFQMTQARDFLTWLRPLVRNPDDPIMRSDPAAALAFDTTAIGNILWAHESFNVGGMGMLTSPADSFQIPAVTWTTLSRLSERVDTPQDRAEQLDWSRLAPQAAATRLMLRRLFDDPEFKPEIKTEETRKTRWRLARGAVVTESVAETVPRTPMPGFITTLVGGGNSQPGPPAGVGIRRHEMAYTGPDGTFRYPPMAGQAGGGVNNLQAQAFMLDDHGRIVQGISDSKSMIAGRVSSTVNLGEATWASPARVIAFDCAELNGPEFFDPRHLEPLSNYSFIDVVGGGTPKRYHFSMHKGQMFGLLVPGTRWQLILRAGMAGNRLVMLNLDPALTEDEGASLREAMRLGGLNMGDPIPSIPAHISARDFFIVNEWRMRRFEAAGISSKAVAEMHAETKELLRRAEEAHEADDGAALQRFSASALANEVRAYAAVRALGDDITRGAIFLMILLVPFAAVMERLLFACRGVGRRISVSTTIFLFMTGVLWSFHPSFRITAQPMIILMAFAILLLSLLVIVMIMRKFESDMESIRSGHAEASGAQTSRAGVIGSAVWLGVANMRKRKVRTALTATTIVLITFALLCFASSTHYQNRRQFNLSNVESPYAGVLIRLPGMRTMHPRAMRSVANLLPDDSRLVGRYWWVSRAPNWRLSVRSQDAGRQVLLKAALGLMPGERELTKPDRFLPNWDRFARGGACYLSENTARTLGVGPGDKVVIAGAELELAGVFDSTPLVGGWRMLDGQSPLPHDFTVEREGGFDTEALEIALAAGAGLSPEMETSYVAGDDLVILPAELARRAGGDLRSLAVRADSGEEAEQIALKLMKVLAFPMYYGEGRNVKVVVSTPLIPRPPRNLLIPLAIAALIVFNTMLNSVAERKREIHIYTSLGLAPRHVGVLFLGEAATYGLMGSVFGYIVGQGAAKALTALDLMGGITLNYSGTNVVMTMGMVMVVVLVSSIVPAVMAGKLATPSKDMKWTVPQPVDGVIRDALPFIVTRAAAGGLTAFIHDFFGAHIDGGIGCFTASEPELLPAEGDRVAGLRATTWLAPYDLGVRQEVLIEIVQDVEDICNVRVELVYGTGQTRTWWRLNKTFLDEVRRQLLGWRNLKTERIMKYISQAEEMARHA